MPTEAVGLKKKLPALSPSDIKNGLKRLRIRFDVSSQPELSIRAASQPRLMVGPDNSTLMKKEVSLKDLIDGGLIKPPANLFKSYKGHALTAVVESDGRIIYEGQAYISLSTAGGMAQRSIVGAQPGQPYPSTNGWTFWTIQTDDGVERLDSLRKRYIRNAAALAS